MIARASAALATLIVALAVSAAPPERSRTEVATFKRENPCPVTGKSRGACEGWQVDHVVPLCAGGADKPANMQWLTVAAHREKTRNDVRVCSTLRKGSWQEG